MVACRILSSDVSRYSSTQSAPASTTSEIGHGPSIASDSMICRKVSRSEVDSARSTSDIRRISREVPMAWATESILCTRSTGSRGRSDKESRTALGRPARRMSAVESDRESWWSRCAPSAIERVCSPLGLLTSNCQGATTRAAISCNRRSRRERSTGSIDPVASPRSQGRSSYTTSSSRWMRCSATLDGVVVGSVPRIQTSSTRRRSLVRRPGLLCPPMNRSSDLHVEDRRRSPDSAGGRHCESNRPLWPGSTNDRNQTRDDREEGVETHVPRSSTAEPAWGLSSTLESGCVNRCSTVHARGASVARG